MRQQPCFGKSNRTLALIFPRTSGGLSGGKTRGHPVGHGFRISYQELYTGESTKSSLDFRLMICQAENPGTSGGLSGGKTLGQNRAEEKQKSPRPSQ